MDGVPAREGPVDREAVAQMIRADIAFVASHPEFVRTMNEEGKRKGPRMRWLVDRHVRPLIDGRTTLFARMPTRSFISFWVMPHWAANTEGQR